MTTTENTDRFPGNGVPDIHCVQAQEEDRQRHRRTRDHEERPPGHEGNLRRPRHRQVPHRRVSKEKRRRWEIPQRQRQRRSIADQKECIT